MDASERVGRLQRQQEALAEFGERALRSDQLQDILQEACRLVRSALGADLAKVMELQEDGHTLLVRAGIGWPPGVVGEVRVQADAGSSEGYALRSGEPAMSPDIETEHRFTYPGFIREAGVRALVNVVILGTEDHPPYGILQVDSRHPRTFNDHEISFLRSYANLVAAAVNRLRIAAEGSRAEAALLESEDHHRASVELNPQIPWTADAAGAVTGFSPRWLDLTGLPQQDAVAGGWASAAHPEDRPHLESAWAQAVAEGTPFDVEARIRTADGTWRWLRARAFPRRPPGQPAGRPVAWYGTMEDIEDRKRLETALQAVNEALEHRVAERTAALRREQEERAAAEEKLRQAQKMEAVGQLTGGIAHDFNNLLTAIIGSLSFLEKRRLQGRYDDLGRYVAAAQTAASRAAALTHRLLAFSRRQTLDPKPTDPNRLISGMEDMIRRTVGPAAHVEVRPEPGAWTTMVDRNQLENALLNLCINARDAMPEGGRLSIATANARLDRAMAAEQDLAPGEYVCVSVADTGAGMTPEVMKRAFDPFFTTKPQGKGTGLGLSMIYGFVRQSGGQVRIVSAPGQGTTATLFLPRHTGTVCNYEASAPRRAATPRQQGKTVLVVDDEDAVRALVAEVLAELGCAVVEAQDGATGLNALRRVGAVDLLVTDVGLPGGMNGWQVADAARRLRPGLPVLFITGYAETAVIGDAALEPGTSLLIKPFDMDDLGGRVRDMLASA
jgi:PAS domain S-box-containing protein